MFPQKICLQKTIPNIPYSKNEHTIEILESDTQETAKQKIIQAIQLSNLIDETFNNPTTEPMPNPQISENMSILKQANSAGESSNAQKSAMIAALKEIVGDEKYEEVKTKLVASDQFKSINLHKNDDN